MAYAALLSLAQTIDQIQNHDQYYPISLSMNQTIISIRDDATSLLAFLKEFREKAISFEGQITEVANKAEDIIEYLMLEKNRSHCRSIKSTPSKVRFKRQLRKVAEKMKSIAGEVIDIKNSATIKDVQRLSDSPAATATSSSPLAPTAKNDMIGRNDDLKVIMDGLCGGPSSASSQLQILPIVGTGGIGKTTLARNAYHLPLIIETFKIRVWVTVSQDYNVEEILSSILISMKELVDEEIPSQSKELMAEKVYKTLKGRRFLIVMDDMWSTKTWDEVKVLFPDDCNGSRIMLTTRLSDVATYADSSKHLHEMQFMDDDQSWNLLQQKVFNQNPCPLMLENIGKKIAESCRGLPLAVVVIGGLLSNVSQTEAAWQEIAKNINLAISANDEEFAAILSLSYTHLPYHLRPCFLYMGGFPEDHEIRVSKLIKLWVAEGIVKSSASKSCEEAAEECLEDLVKRNLVLITERKCNGKIKSCGLHDLLRDLCLINALEEKFLLYFSGRFVLSEIFQNQRRISISYSDCLSHIHSSTIHTVICYQHSQSPIASLKKFRLLRILDMVKAKAYVNHLPAQVFELFHLRYLAFYSSMRISAAISNLQNLETLIIHPMQPHTLVHLPVEIWRLPNLKHLISFSFHPLPHPEGATFPLKNLQTLSLAKNFICTERILEMIPNLKKLGIGYSEDKVDQDYHLNNLENLHQLEKLKLEVDKDFPFRQKLNPVFPATLKKLTLSGCRLPWEDMKILSSLPDLEVLKLREFAFQGEEWETIEGEFPKLKFLLIDNSDPERWTTECSHFPVLKSVRLHRCFRLREIPNDIGDISTLEMIEVDDRNGSLVNSAKQIQEEQEESGNISLQVRYSYAL